MAVLGYLPKLKRSLRLAFGTHFLHDFSVQMLFNILSMEKVSISYLLSFSLYQTKRVVYTVDDVKNFKNYLRSTFKAMAAKQKERGRWKYKNLNISRKKKAFKMK